MPSILTASKVRTIIHDLTFERNHLELWLLHCIRHVSPPSREKNALFETTIISNKEIFYFQHCLFEMHVVLSTLYRLLTSGPGYKTPLVSVVKIWKGFQTFNLTRKKEVRCPTPFLGYISDDDRFQEVKKELIARLYPHYLCIMCHVLF
jgi:hypothetical protein